MCKIKFQSQIHITYIELDEAHVYIVCLAMYWDPTSSKHWQIYEAHSINQLNFLC